MDDNQNEIAKSMSGRRNNEKEEVEFKNECVPPVNDNDIKPSKKYKDCEGKGLKEEENDKGGERSEDTNSKKDKGKGKENDKNAKPDKENDNNGEDRKDKMKGTSQEVKENEATKEKNVTSKHKETNKGKEVKESAKEKGSGSLKKSDSKFGKDNENRSSKDDKKSSQKKKKSDHGEKGNALKSDETIRSVKSDSKDEGGDKKKKSSKKKKSGKETDKDSDKREDDKSDRKKVKRESTLKAATRRDFCSDTDDDEDSRGKERGATRRRDDGENKPRVRDSWERKRDDYDSRRGRNVDDESYCKMRGCDRRRRSDRYDDYREQDLSNNNFCVREGRESRGCYLGEPCSGGKKSSYREVRVSRMDCSKREKDGRRDMCIKEGRKDPCNFLTEGKRDSWRELTERKRDTCKQCGKEGKTDRDGICFREYEEGRERQRKPESRVAVEGYGREHYREDTEVWKTSYRDGRRDWRRDEHYGKRDLYRDEREESSSVECDARREGSGMEREGRRGAQSSESGNAKNGCVEESGERREGRGFSEKRDEKDRREVVRSEDGEDKSARNDCSARRSENQWTKDEIYRLKDKLINLQKELEQMRSCLKTAISLAERNKCTMTKLKEHLQCNLPDFAKIREKLKECQLLRLRLCGENTANKTNWNKDFEFLMCELNAVKCELDNMKKEKR